MSANMVWLDVETSGLNELPKKAADGKLLEVGMIITTELLEPVSRAAWAFQITRDDLPIFEDEALKMHLASGLLFECYGIRQAPAATQRDILRWMDSRIGSNVKLPMAGSTVGFDRRWIEAHLPGVFARFHYRNIDVSTVKNLARMWVPDLPEFKGRKLHRALPDLEDSIAELKFYAENGVITSPLRQTSEDPPRQDGFRDSGHSLDGHGPGYD